MSGICKWSSGSKTAGTGVVLCRGLAGGVRRAVLRVYYPIIQQSLTLQSPFFTPLGSNRLVLRFRATKLHNSSFTPNRELTRILVVEQNYGQLKKVEYQF